MAILVLKIIFVLSFLFFVALIIYFGNKSGYFKFIFIQDFSEMFSFMPYGSEKAIKQWVKVKNRLEFPSEADHKLAIIEADEMLDEILSRMRTEGETLDEKLRKLTSLQLPNVSQVLQAHEARNNIIRDPDYRFSLEEAKELIETYEKALEYLQMI